MESHEGVLVSIFALLPSWSNLVFHDHFCDAIISGGRDFPVVMNWSKFAVMKKIIDLR